MSLKTILKYLLYAAIFTPLLKFPYTVFPFVFAKAVFFQIIVSVALILYLWLLMKGQITWPKKSKIFWTAIIFLGVVTLASVFGSDFARSFWDVQERMTGLFNLFYYLVFLMMLLSVFETKEDGRQLATAIWIMGGLLMLSGYAQKFNANFWGYPAYSRIAGLLNNPIFYAMAMVWQVFLSLFLAAEETDKKKKIIYFVGALAAFYAIYLSRTRGAMIGVAAGLLFYGLGEVLAIKDKSAKIKILALIGLAGASIFILWLNRDQALVQKSPLGYYLDISPFAGTGATRLLAWKAAYSGFLEHPIFGWGLNNFNIIFNQFYNPESLRYTAYETWFDRTHNVTLEFLSTTGAVGLAAYLSLFIVAFILIWKAIHHGFAPRPLLILGAGLVAYFIQNQFALDQPTSLLLFFSCLALISIYGEAKEKLIISVGYRHRFALAAIIVAIIFSVYKFNIIPLYAGYLDVLGVATAETDYNFSKLQFKKALAIKHPYRFDSVIEFTQSVIKASIAEKLTPETRAADFSLAEQEMKNLIAQHPRQTYYHYLLGRLYSEWGRHEARYFASAETAFREAEKLSPRRQQIFFGLGEMYLFAKKYDQAEATFRQMVALEPRVGEAHWYLGLTLNQIAKNKEAEPEFLLAYQYGYAPRTKEELDFFVNLFEAQKRFKDIALIYDAYIEEREPNSGELYAKSAAAWLAAGEFDKARLAVALAVKYDVSLQTEADIFLKMIEQAEKNQNAKIKTTD